VSLHVVGEAVFSAAVLFKAEFLQVDKLRVRGLSLGMNDFIFDRHEHMSPINGDESTSLADVIWVR